MSISEFQQEQFKQQELERKFEEIAAKRAKERKLRDRLSYCIHTPKEVLQRLGERWRNMY